MVDSAAVFCRASERSSRPLVKCMVQNSPTVCCNNATPVHPWCHCPFEARVTRDLPGINYADAYWCGRLPVGPCCVVLHRSCKTESTIHMLVCIPWTRCRFRCHAITCASTPRDQTPLPTHAYCTPRVHRIWSRRCYRPCQPSEH